MLWAVPALAAALVALRTLAFDPDASGIGQLFVWSALLLGPIGASFLAVLLLDGARRLPGSRWLRLGLGLLLIGVSIACAREPYLWAISV